MLEDVEVGKCLRTDEAGVEYSAQSVGIDRAPLTESRTWLAIGLRDFGLLPTDEPAEPTFVIRDLPVDGVSPDSRYVRGLAAGVDPIVVRLADGRIVMQMVGAGSNVLVDDGDRAVAVVSDDACDPGRLLTVDLRAQRTVSRRALTGTTDGVKPIRIVGDTVIAERVIPGEAGQESKGVITVDLRTGRVRDLTKRGVVAAVTTSPARVWVTGRGGTRVLTLDGEQVGGTASTVVAGPLDDGSVAYALFDDRPEALRLASADGPKRRDPTAHSGGRIDRIVAVPGGRVAVAWTDAGTEELNGVDVCDPTNATCEQVFASPSLGLGSGLVGTLTTPIPAAP